MNDKKLTLSIVIPAYNEEDYLKPCLEAIAAQTVRPKQVIVVDNNSTDETAKIASSYPFVTLLRVKRRGVIFARNAGFGAVGSDLIGRIDADTIIGPNWVEHVIAMFEQNPAMDAVSGPTGFYDFPGQTVTLWLTKVIRTTLFYIGHRATKYLFGSNMAVRTTAWRKVKSKTCSTRGIHEDNDLAIHLEEAGFSVHYSNNLVATISLRRADTPPREAFHYAFMEPRTFKLHGMFSIQSWIGGVILLIVYLPLKLLRRAYDNQKQKFSFKKFITYKSKPRPQPMG